MNTNQLKTNYRLSLLHQKNDVSSKSYEVTLRNAMVGLNQCQHKNEHPAKMFYIDKIAFIHRTCGNYIQALSFYKQKQDLALHQNRTTELVDSLYWQGVLYERTGHSKKAIKLLFEALAFDINDYKVKIYNCLSILYNNLGKPLDAQRYVEKSLEIIAFLVNYEDIIDTYILASENCLRIDQYLKANTYIDKAYSLVEKKNIFDRKGTIYYLKGRILATQEILDSAKEYLNRAKQHLKINKVWHTYIHCNIILAQVFELDNEVERAIDSLEKILPFVKNSELFIEQRDIYFQLQGYYKQLNDTNKAYEYLLLADQTRQTLHQRQLGFFKNQVQDELLEKLELINQDLTYSNQQNDSLQHELTEAKTILNSLEEEKLSIEETIKAFAYNLRHPMHNLYRMAQVIYRQKDNNNTLESADNYSQYFLEETKKLDNYFTHLTLYSDVNRDEDILEREISSIKHVISDIAVDINFLKEKKDNIKVIYDSSLPEIWVDEEHYKLLINHLILNIISLTTLEPSYMIEVHIKETLTNYQFEIVEMRMAGALEDSKKKDVEFPKIFNLLKILDLVAAENLVGSLALCKKIVKLYNGKIWATFIQKKGFAFSFSINKEEFVNIEDDNVTVKNTQLMDITNMKVRYRLPKN